MIFAKFLDSHKIEYASKSIVVGDKRIYNPTEQMLREAGYKEFISSDAPSEYYDVSYIEDGDYIRQVWTEWDANKKLEVYPSLVSKLVAEQYSITDEIALIRQRDVKPNEFAQYTDYVERCKLSARLLLGLDRQNEDID